MGASHRPVWPADCAQCGGTVKSTNFSDYAFEDGHQGGTRDANTGLYSFRNRWLNAGQMRWNRPDPLGYVDGMSYYEYVGSNPLTSLDPSGLGLISCHRMLQEITIIFQMNRNGWPGAVTNDQFAHCYISCRLAQECGYIFSGFLGTLREGIQQFGDRQGSIDDMLANADGLAIGDRRCSTRQSCIDGCTQQHGDPGDMYLP